MAKLTKLKAKIRVHINVRQVNEFLLLGLKLVRVLAKIKLTPRKLLYFVNRHNAEWTKFESNILLMSSNNQIPEFRIPNIYNEIFVLIFLMILRTHF